MSWADDQTPTRTGEEEGLRGTADSQTDRTYKEVSHYSAGKLYYKKCSNTVLSLNWINNIQACRWEQHAYLDVENRPLRHNS